MSGTSLKRLLDKAAIQGGFLATAAALMFGFLTQGSVINPWPFIVPMAGIFVWALFAVAARLIFARKASDAPLLKTKIMLWWIAIRMALFVAVTILFFCLLVALPIGSPWSGIVGRAIFLSLLVSFLLTTLGQAAINSSLVFAHLRRGA